MFDLLENELEEGDPIKIEEGEHDGENLLLMCYTLPSYLSQLKYSSEKRMLFTTQTEDVLIR